MTWVKMDDAFADHPKVMALGRDRMAGLGVWVAAACYCARYLTDGFVPEAVARGFGSPKLLARLVAVGLADRVDGGYKLHDWLDYNPSRDKVLAERAAAKARMDARRSPDVRPNGKRTNDDVPEKFNDPVPVPGPQPVPVSPFEYQEPRELYLTRTRRKRLSEKEADWLEDMHARHSRSELCRALLAVETGPDYLNRVKAYLTGRAA